MPYNLFTSSGEKCCYLCLRTDQPWTGEHVVPQWLSEWLLPKAGGLAFSWENADGSTQREIRFTWQVGVCDSCNQWMENWFEDPNKRLLKALIDPGSGSVDALSRSQQMHLAGWFFKSCVMEDAYHYGVRGSDARAPRREIEHLHRFGVPTFSTTIWIGQLEANFTGGLTPQNSRPKDELIASLVVPTSWGPMWTVYRLFVLILCQEPRRDYRPIGLPSEARPFLTEIWPSNDDKVSWPPPAIIDRSTYDALRKMVTFGPWST